VALALVRSFAADPGTVVHVRIGDAQVAGRIAEPPVYRRPGPAEQAERQYHRGLAAFEHDRFEEAIALFEKAMLMNPEHAAALEAIGVSQERLGLLEDAAATMRDLADLDPDNPMAWTNLSRYYARQGRIEEAESAKGRAAYLSMKREAGEAEARRRSVEEAEADRRRREERVDLFRGVLEIDPGDVVANFGLGKLLADLGRPAEAVDHFERALAAQPDYSMAYAQLGLCLEAVGDRERAAEILRRGIAVAAGKGDLMPKRTMELRLEALESGRDGTA
jgi:tetratricopeptide (TPR) repeat protein